MRPEFSLAASGVLWYLVIAAGVILATIFTLRYFMSRKSAQLYSKKEKGNDASLSSRNKFKELDVFKYRGSLIGLSLVLVLGLIVTAINVEIYEQKVEKNFVLSWEEDIELEIPRTNEPPPPPPPPPPPTNFITEVSDVLLEDDDIEFVDQSLEEDTEVFAEPVSLQKEEEVVPPPPPPPPPPEPEVEEIFRVVEEMARFPGCEDLVGTKQEKRACAEKKLMEFVYAHIVYPPIAVENNIEGTAVVSFVVEKNGSISQVECLRDPGGGLGEEAVRVIGLMNKDNIIWSPGKQRGRPVRLMFTLPVRFKLILPKT